MLTARGLAVVSSFALSSAAAAQTAVQWRVEDGGNGHWYASADAPTGDAAIKLAQAEGGHLATITSAGENEFIRVIYAATGKQSAWLGLRQASGQATPDAGWYWITGEPSGYLNWSTHNGAFPTGAPDDSPCALPPWGVENDQANQGVMQNDGRWDDLETGAPTCGSPQWNNTAIIEWSADCNNDGIVDYGQILNGDFADSNGNGVPDACELCSSDWVSVGDALSVPTQAEAWYGPGGQFLDANGDGIKDVVFACRPLQCRLGLGGGHFGPTIVSEPQGWFSGYCVADLNGDGRDDFVSYDYFGGRDRVMLSLGDGRYAESQALVTGNYATPCKAADMDGDGDIDIVGGTELEGYLRIFRNNGQGVFDAGVTIGGMGQYHREMELADLDGDGDLDIVVQNEWVYDTVRILRNDGAMQFTQVPGFTYPSGFLHMVVMDYDRDGDVDIVASTRWGDLRAYRKDPGGLNYTLVQLGSYSNRTLTLELFDVDGDGLKDLFIGDDDRFGIARSRTAGGFEPPVWTTVLNKDRFTLVDVDNDGVLDVATGKQTPKSLGTIDFLARSCGSLTVPTDFATVQAAIDSVPAGTHRVIRLLPGTYNESFSLNGKDIVIRGAADGTTILDGTGLPASIATFTGGEPSTAGLEHIVFRNGTVGSLIYKGALFKVGGAVYGTNSSAFIRNCRFENNRSDYGGGAYLLYCSMLVEGCTFASNTGISQGGGLMVFGTTGSVRGCSFTGNQCGLAGIGGGSAFKAAGALNTGEIVLFDGCTVTGNSAGVEGGAVEYYENVELHPGVLRIVNSSITGNRSGFGALAGAGGLMVTGRMQSVVVGSGTTLCGNLPRNADGPYFIEGSPTICDCEADLSGDGVVNGGDLGILLSSWGATLPTGVGDVNHDGLVNGADLAVLLSSWGACP